MGGCCSKGKDDKPLDFDVGIEVNANHKVDTDNDVNFRNDTAPKTNGVHTQNELSLFQDLSKNHQDPELNTEKEKEENVKTNNNDKNLNHQSSLEMSPELLVTSDVTKIVCIKNATSDIDKCENGVTDNFPAASKDTTVNDTKDTSKNLEKEDAAIKSSNETESIRSVTNNAYEISAQQDQLKLLEDTKDTPETNKKEEHLHIRIEN